MLDKEDVEGLLSGSFFVPDGARRTRPQGEKEDNPTHYKVICISMYTEDLARLDSMVDELKARGLTKANRSALIRYALGAVKVEDVPKGL